ncbi:CocE/NonD family hydrolase [Hymenobacter busanensis]|uniref:CocE/NonD family hydrolase n=1 Tax=Hymenobacter busanensis TaxID=2607656 RepID=A0A7L4ZS09_9BACT|nr:CocE/NonD family hydrolase [Hymenobacter busanensis]KAA9327627.1 CocE/NonD family hydrolase [Hymenobacter busanensis]QHJ06034.1 CocE/NonD family hydrolase [Hymenobacter busanensis]
MSRFLLVALALMAAGSSTVVQAQGPTAADARFVQEHYTKLDRQIPMRDGVKLYTTIYVPKDASKTNPYPFLLHRTPYSAGPYGEKNYTKGGPGRSQELSREQYIFVDQDVRGRYMSEGQFEEMTPALPAGAKATGNQSAPHDESTDTYDTIEWLLKNVPNHNGRVGLMGISYPGFYATAALPNAHPALKAVSPQAPVTDEFIGDDANHKGAFYLLDNFGFMNYFDAPRKGPTAKYDPLFQVDFKDAYPFFLQLGPLKNANGPKYFNGRAKTWNEYLAHPTYDAYWQARNIRTALKNVQPAVLVVGGWYDAEDLFGALATYKAIEQQSPGANNRLVMGPWTHGAWARQEWRAFGPLRFGQNTAQYYRDNLELKFFNHYLKGKGDFAAAEATVFDAGTNQWRTYDAWPPRAAQPRLLYLQAAHQLTFDAPKAAASHDEYVSDPANPVPYTSGTHAERNNEYMVEDQRFAAKRPDVLTFQTAPLTQDLTLAGPLTADLFVSTTGTDADFVVKLIDVLPDSAVGTAPGAAPAPRAGYQRLVRAEPIRGKFRNSFEKPEPFQPGQVAEIKYELPDVLHTFRKGHRLMVQVQSSWFPLVDRNPQQFVDIPKADAKDFQKATIRLYHDAKHPSGLTLPVLP